jgi:hypothetical protein
LTLSTVSFEIHAISQIKIFDVVAVVADVFERCRRDFPVACLRKKNRRSFKSLKLKLRLFEAVKEFSRND